MNIEKVKITPTVAADWLALRSDMQRHISQGNVDKIASAIAAGEWRENGATIVFNAKGELIDGQHRLAAIAKAGRTVWALVVRGVSSNEETFSTIDDAKRRTVSDFMMGTKNRTSVATLAKFYWLAAHDKNLANADAVPISSVMKTASPHLESMSAWVTDTLAAQRVCGSAFIGFVAWYHASILGMDASKIRAFTDAVATGADLAPGDVRLLLRNRMLGITSNRGNSANYKISRPAKIALILKAFYAFMDGKPVQKLQWQDSKEDMPELRKESRVRP